MRLCLAVAAAMTAGCQTPTQPAPTPPPASAATATPPIVTTPPKYRLCGRTVTDPYATVPADVAALIHRVTAPDASHIFPQPPEPPIEVIEGVAAEVVRPVVREAFESLDPKRRNVVWFAALEKLRDQGAKWCIAAALDHPSIDVRIKAAHTLGDLGDLATAAYMTEVARAAAVFVSGSESATLQGIDQQTLARALDACTHEHTTLGPNQDPEGLEAAIPVWTKRVCR